MPGPPGGRGCCVMGYTWLPQTRGWRCAGGHHYLTESGVEDVEKEQASIARNEAIAADIRARQVRLNAQQFMMAPMDFLRQRIILENEELVLQGGRPYDAVDQARNDEIDRRRAREEAQGQVRGQLYGGQQQQQNQYGGGVDQIMGMMQGAFNAQQQLADREERAVRERQRQREAQDRADRDARERQRQREAQDRAEREDREARERQRRREAQDREERASRERQRQREAQDRVDREARERQRQREVQQAAEREERATRERQRQREAQQASDRADQAAREKQKERDNQRQQQQQQQQVQETAEQIAREKQRERDRIRLLQANQPQPQPIRAAAPSSSSRAPPPTVNTFRGLAQPGPAIPTQTDFERQREEALARVRAVHNAPPTRGLPAPEPRAPQGVPWGAGSRAMERERDLEEVAARPAKKEEKKKEREKMPWET